MLAASIADCLLSLRIKLAKVVGIEPTPTGLESVVLPLYYTPIKLLVFEGVTFCSVTPLIYFPVSSKRLGFRWYQSHQPNKALGLSC